MFRSTILVAVFLALASAAGVTRASEPSEPTQERITVHCGDISLLLRRASQWTPGRIDFRGIPMTTERSAYGTVFSIPEVGFIGTGHLENEPEPLTALHFFLDGVELDDPDGELTGDTFRFERSSRVREFELHGTIEIRNGRLHETARVRTAEATPLTLVYHFMHAWRPTVSAFLAGRDESPEGIERGGLLDTKETTRRFYIEDRVDWVAVYEPESGQFAVSRILEVPDTGKHVSKIWNVPGTYRKYYLKSFQNETVPAGFEGTWRMVTAFGAGDSENWEDAARTLAEKLRE